MNDDSLDEDVQSEETMDDPWGWDDEEMEEDDQTVPDNSEANDSANAAVNDGAYDETATNLSNRTNAYDLKKASKFPPSARQ